MSYWFALVIGMLLGGLTGFAIVGTFLMEKETGEIEEARHTIRKQAKIITDQSLIIAGMRQQIMDMEDDGK